MTKWLNAIYSRDDQQSLISREHNSNVHSMTHVRGVTFPIFFTGCICTCVNTLGYMSVCRMCPCPCCCVPADLVSHRGNSSIQLVLLVCGQTNLRQSLRQSNHRTVFPVPAHEKELMCNRPEQAPLSCASLIAVLGESLPLCGIGFQVLLSSKRWGFKRYLRDDGGVSVVRTDCSSKTSCRTDKVEVGWLCKQQCESDRGLLKVSWSLLSCSDTSDDWMHGRSRMSVKYRAAHGCRLFLVLFLEVMVTKNPCARSLLHKVWRCSFTSHKL